MSMDLRALREQIGASSPIGDVVEVARRFVGVDTVTGREANLVPQLAKHLEAAGLEVRQVDLGPGRANVYGRLPGSGGGTTTLLVGHGDTVGVSGWQERWGGDQRGDPWGATVIDDRLWGLGSADDKGGIAAFCSALAALGQLGLRPRGDVLVAVVADEESGEEGMGLSVGAKALVAEIEEGRLPRPDLAIYVEPTGLEVYAAQPGFFIATISVKGQASYFAYPWRGRSAIRDATRVLEALEEHESARWHRGRHPSVGRPLLVVTGIQGGESISVPEHCKISLIETVLPGERLEDARAELEEVLHRLALERGISTAVEYPASRDDRIGGSPMETDAASPLVELLARCAGTEHSAAITAAPYWSELPLLAAIGVPGVYFGPGDIAVCHTAEEHVALGELRSAAVTLATFLAAAPASSVRHSSQQPSDNKEEQ